MMSQLFLTCFLVLAVGGTVRAGQIECAQVSSATVEEADLLWVLQGRLKTGCFDVNKLAELKEDIKNIKAKYKEVSRTQDFTLAAGRQIFTQYALEVPGRQLEDEEIHKSADFFAQWDVKVFSEQYYPNGNFHVLRVTFNQPYDIRAIGTLFKELQIIADAKEYAVARNPYDDIWRLNGKDQSRWYVFRETENWADCSSGCPGDYHFFKISVDGNIEKLYESSEATNQWAPYWAFRERFNLLRFMNRDGLLAGLQSGQWDTRLHAGAALRMILVHGGSLYGEDSAAEIYQLINDINSNKDFWQKRMDEFMSQEDDIVVKAAARLDERSFLQQRRALEWRAAH